MKALSVLVLGAFLAVSCSHSSAKKDCCKDKEKCEKSDKKCDKKSESCCKDKKKS